MPTRYTKFSTGPASTQQPLKQLRRAISEIYSGAMDVDPDTWMFLDHYLGKIIDCADDIEVETFLSMEASS
jgi:hypothetical protein